MFTKKKQYSITEIADKFKLRQSKRFDAIVAISGTRGSGKSTIAYKIARKFKDFKPSRDIVYSRKELNQALAKKKYGVVMADEMVIAGYKRTFWDSDQIQLIQMINTYRDSCNLLIMCIPSFSSLDKDLRKLVKFRIHVVKRGFAIVHLAKNTDYKDDPWDFKYNLKIEEEWSKKRIKKPRYTKLSTFAGYLQFGDLTQQQKDKYQKIKEHKRNIALGGAVEVENPKETKFYTNLANLCLDGKMTRADLEKVAVLRGITYKTVADGANRALVALGSSQKVTDLVRTQEKRQAEALAEAVKAKALNLTSESPHSLRNRKEEALS